MATLKQKKAISKTIEILRKNKEPKPMGKIMLESGYKKSVSEHPKVLTESKAWKDILEEINDEAIVKKIRRIALAKEDKRANLQAADMLLKLKNRYPDVKMRLGIFEERETVIE